MRKEIQSEIKILAEQKGIPYSWLYDVFEAPFGLIDKVTKIGPNNNDEFSNIRVPGFALFFVSEKRKQLYLREKKNKERRLNGLDK